MQDNEIVICLFLLFMFLTLLLFVLRFLEIVSIILEERGKMKDVIPNSDLDNAAEELYNAVYKYREFLKRNYRDRLAGVIWLKRGNEVVIYSENAKYTEQVCRLTWDARGDSFSLIEANYLE